MQGSITWHLLGSKVSLPFLDIHTSTNEIGHSYLSIVSTKERLFGNHHLFLRTAVPHSDGHVQRYWSRKHPIVTFCFLSMHRSYGSIHFQDGLLPEFWTQVHCWVFQWFLPPSPSLTTGSISLLYIDTIIPTINFEKSNVLVSWWTLGFHYITIEGFSIVSLVKYWLLSPLQSATTIAKDTFCIIEM